MSVCVCDSRVGRFTWRPAAGPCDYSLTRSTLCGRSCNAFRHVTPGTAPRHDHSHGGRGVTPLFAVSGEPPPPTPPLPTTETTTTAARTSLLSPTLSVWRAAWEQAMGLAVRISRCFWLLSLCLSLSVPGVQCQQSFRPAGLYTSGTGSGSGSGHGSRNGGTSAYGAVNSGTGPRYRMAGPSVSSSRAQVSNCSLTSAFIVGVSLSLLSSLLSSMSETVRTRFYIVCVCVGVGVCVCVCVCVFVCVCLFVCVCV